MVDALTEYQRGLRQILRQQFRRARIRTCMRGCARRGGCEKQNKADAEEMVREVLDELRAKRGHVFKADPLSEEVDV